MVPVGGCHPGLPPGVPGKVWEERSQEQEHQVAGRKPWHLSNTADQRSGGGKAPGGPGRGGGRRGMSGDRTC